MEPRKPKLITVTRLIVGGIFLASAVNGVLGIIPLPTGGPSGALLTTLAGSGYFYPLLRAVELIGAALLLSGWLVPLALTLLAPVVVNVAAFHLFLAPQGLPVAGLLVAGELLLAWHHRSAFRSMVGAGPATQAAGSVSSSAMAVGGAS
jgi:hypothetical protein